VVANFIAYLSTSGMLTHIHILNVAVSWGLFVLVWLVQTIIYPGLARIPSNDFANYHAWYVTRITIVVFPLMIFEIIIAIAWFFLQDDLFYPIVAIVLVMIVWCSTITFQIPIHKSLQAGKDKSKIRRLVATNWMRTIAWSLKAFIAVVFAAESLG
jgi:hypothetical protein